MTVVAQIASLLGTTASEAAYRAGEDAVYELNVRSAALNRDITLILWPGLGRADIRLGDSSMVFKQIDVVELYAGVEVLFRRHDPPGYLFLSTTGRASMVM